MKKKSIFIMALSLIMLFSLGQSIMAFSDIKGHSNGHKITSLKDKGIINGNSKGKFNPGEKLTYASGVSMLVKGLELNIDHIRFIKEPKVKDYFKNLKNDGWYAQDFIIAHLNGLEIPQDVKANDPMTREQFAHHLFQAMSRKTDFTTTEIYYELKDSKDVNNAYINSIQKLLNSKIATLDKNNKFHPKKSIKRSEAAEWLYDGLEFIKKQTPPIVLLPEEQPGYEQILSIEAVNRDVNKVTITAQLPHPGYGLRISSISFIGQQALIQTELILPDPNWVYPQVITEVKISTYVDAALQVVLSQKGNGQSTTNSLLPAS